MRALRLVPGASVPRSRGRCGHRAYCFSPAGFSFGFCGRGNLGPFRPLFLCSDWLLRAEKPRGPSPFESSLDVQRDGGHRKNSSPPGFVALTRRGLQRSSPCALGHRVFRYPKIASCRLPRSKSGRTSAPRPPQPWQTNRGSRSESLTSSGQRSSPRAT